MLSNTSKFAPSRNSERHNPDVFAIQDCAPRTGGLVAAFKIAGLCLLVAGCALSRPLPEYSITSNESAVTTPDGEQSTSGEINTGDAVAPRPRTIADLLSVPTIGDASTDPNTTGAVQAPPFSVEQVDTVVPSLALPSFIDLVFGQILDVPYSTGPGVAQRSEIVQLRSSGTMPAEVFYGLVTMTLKDYGIRVAPEDGVYQILEDSALKARIPRFIKSRARAETPAGLRPIVQYVELNAIDASTMAGILSQAIANNNDNLTVNAQSSGNFVVLNGLPEDVNAALSIIYDMDELRFAGTQVQRISPRYWDSQTLAEEIRRILSAEGWQVSLDSRSPMPILLLSVERSNDILVFTGDAQARARVAFWARELDRPSQEGDSPQVYVYSVQNMDAAILANTVNQVLSGIDAQSAPPGLAAARAAAAAAANGGNGATNSIAGGLVVDPLGNRLVFSGTPNEYERLLPLLRQLDLPPAEVLIEVMIAQVQLTDSTDFGVDWTIRNLNDKAFNSTFARGTDAASGLSGIVSNGGVGPAGIAFGVLSPDVEVAIDAFAQNNQVNVLSTPRLLARSGASASVQVGTEVPFLSSQATTDIGGGDNGAILQEVQYRSTGIILQIEPIVFSDNRIDLTISQEVSSTLPGTGVGGSPIFSNTSVATLLSLEDGGTAVIGGLIQDNISRDNSGVPFIKDVPVLGSLFSTNSTSVDRTELVILIKAYVVRGQSDRSAFANKYRSEIDRTLQENNLKTLRPRDF